MKTKIIYISGGENLDRAAIKTAFDEVRETLGLGNDTLLFGVPLEDEIAQESVSEQPELVEITKITEEIIQKPKKTRKTKIEEVKEESIEELVEEPVKEIQIITEIISEEPTQEVNEEPTPEVERVIPILSVLSVGKSESVQPAATVQIVSVTDFSDALDEELPEEESRIPQTIEEIFENLTPLPEEKIIETPRIKAEESSRDESMDDDATLAMLAAEFVETQNTPAAPVDGRPGKMGKLKNILPFKKAKKAESGVLDDLFGWAGIAANEDDAGPSGFFAAR